MRAWRAARWNAIRHEAATTRGFSTSPFRTRHQNIADLLQNGSEGEAVSVQGWVRSLRKQKKVAFVAVGDGSTTTNLQATMPPDQATHLSYGTAVRLSGDWRASPGRGQSHELATSGVEILGENDAEASPLQPKYQTPEFLRTIPHLRARTPQNALMLRLRSQLIAALTNFFSTADFVQCHTPIITSSDCEGAGEVFTVSSNESKASEQSTKDTIEDTVEHFFRAPKYLTVSAQLHLEALAQSVDKVWTLSPTFRAEKSDTPRHLSEFYMLEAEMCFTRSLDEVMDLVENMLRSSVGALKRTRMFEELQRSRSTPTGEAAPEKQNLVTAEALHERWNGMIASSWPRITYEEAIARLQEAHSSAKATFEHSPSYEAGLQAEHERWLATAIGHGKPVFVTHYPRPQKPFYMPPSSPGAQTVACFDLLVPDLCELVGGSLREHRLADLRATMEAKDVKGEGLEWYQDLRRFGSVPHGGFGLGFDRLLCYLGGVGNVRDVVAFPRWYGRCEC